MQNPVPTSESLLPFMMSCLFLCIKYKSKSCRKYVENKKAVHHSYPAKNRSDQLSEYIVINSTYFLHIFILKYKNTPHRFKIQWNLIRRYSFNG